MSVLRFLVELQLYSSDDMGLSGFLYDYFHDNNLKFFKLRTYLTPCVC